MYSPPNPETQPWNNRESGNGHAQLSEFVAMRLREQIISGQLKKGQFLRIDSIAKALGVSMTPVREGLLLLRSDSFVQLIPRRGFVVNSFSKDDLLDLFWAQATIGAELASRAAVKMSTQQIDRLEKMQAEYEVAIAAGNESLVARLGHEFHRALNLAAESPRLALLLGNLTKQLPNHFYASIEGQLKEAVQYHPIILNAIKLRDGKAAGSLMYRHIVSGGEHLAAMLEPHGAWGHPSEGKVADAPAVSSKTTPARRSERGKSAAPADTAHAAKSKKKKAKKP
jgi:DNA-binding GntR family transcriptional regulator